MRIFKRVSEWLGYMPREWYAEIEKREKEAEIENIREREDEIENAADEVDVREKERDNRNERLNSLLLSFREIANGFGAGVPSPSFTGDEPLPEVLLLSFTAIEEALTSMAGAIKEIRRKDVILDERAKLLTKE